MKKGQKDILQDIWDKEAESYSPDAESSPAKMRDKEKY